MMFADTVVFPTPPFMFSTDKTGDGMMGCPSDEEQRRIAEEVSAGQEVSANAVRGRKMDRVR